MQNEQLKQKKEIENRAQTSLLSNRQISKTIEEKPDQQSLIASLRRHLETAIRQSAQKDKEIACLRSNVSEHADKITKLQAQVDTLESLLSKIIKRKDQQYKRYFDQKPNQGVYRSYHFETEQFQAPKDKDMMSNISQAKLGSSRKGGEGYLQNSRIGNLSNSRNSRRQQLLNCQNMKDVLKLPEYRNG